MSRASPVRAEDRDRTGTRLPPLVFETSASTYSATSAQAASIASMRAWSGQGNVVDQARLANAYGQRQQRRPVDRVELFEAVGVGHADVGRVCQWPPSQSGAPQLPESRARALARA